MVIQRELDVLRHGINGWNSNNVLGLSELAVLASSTCAVWAIGNCIFVAVAFGKTDNELRAVAVRKRKADLTARKAWARLCAIILAAHWTDRAVSIHDDGYDVAADQRVAEIDEAEWEANERQHLERVQWSGRTAEERMEIVAYNLEYKRRSKHEEIAAAKQRLHEVQELEALTIEDAARR